MLLVGAARAQDCTLNPLVTIPAMLPASWQRVGPGFRTLQNLCSIPARRIPATEKAALEVGRPEAGSGAGDINISLGPQSLLF